MFNKAQKLMKNSLHHSEIKRIFKKGKRVVYKQVVIIYEKHQEDFGRYAILISKKKVRKSRERNRIRSVVREVVRSLNIPKHPFLIIYSDQKQPTDQVRGLIKKALESIV